MTDTADTPPPDTADTPLEPVADAPLEPVAAAEVDPDEEANAAARAEADTIDRFAAHEPVARVAVPELLIAGSTRVTHADLDGATSIIPTVSLEHYLELGWTVAEDDPAVPASPPTASPPADPTTEGA